MEEEGANAGPRLSPYGECEVDSDEKQEQICPSPHFATVDTADARSEQKAVVVDGKGASSRR